MSPAVCAVCHGPWGFRHHCPTGADLRAEREAAGLTRADVARTWHVWDTYVGRLEKQSHVTVDAARKYRQARREGR